ncbi:MAG: DUF4258 domain-containing protein [Planctomycetota bacterium]|nr:DUF4258 domain-containing protein [Planctomycetota bacterium]
MSGEPFSYDEARRRIRRIPATGTTAWTRHALGEMAKDGMSQVDAVSVLRAGLVRSWDLVTGTYRYRVETRKFCVVVAFRDDDQLVVVTAWRF